MSAKPTLEDIVSLCKRRGFIYQGSEIYGGLAGTWDYGPLGVVLKRNIINLWLKWFVDGWDDMYQVDAAILMNQKVWQASGHVDTFTDPLVECSECRARFRADRFPHTPPSGNVGEDKLWYEKWLDNYRAIHGFSDSSAGQKAAKAQTESLQEGKVVCPNCLKLATFGQPRQFNMMFATPYGPTWGSFEPKYDNTLSGDIKSYDTNGNLKEKFNIKEFRSDINSLMAYDKRAKSYLRPETAQGIFTNYKNILDSFYPDLPFGIAQIGKAFRNEISPRDFVFRSREFEQMEIEYFVDPKTWEKSFEKWVKDVHGFLDDLGLPTDKIHELEVPEADRAHYSKRTIDFEFDFPHGRHELLGLAYRTDFDLMNIQNNSGKSMAYTPKAGGEAFVPHVIEPSFGVERAVMAVLTSAYQTDEVNGEGRSYLKLPAHLAPVKVAVSPLLKNKKELADKARTVYDQLKKEFGAVMYDDNGNIGKRYRRQDEIGTPYCVTVDFDTLEDDTVTVRDRDTTQQERVKISELGKKLK